MTTSALSMYRELARYYDLLYDWKDYRSECKRLETIARRFGRPGKTAWLDVACGTGRHLEFLMRGHSVAGVDKSPQMLQIARRRLPRVPLIVGDMRAFRLNRRFDVVSCLFSAIGHLRTEREVRRAFANLARHLTPGGVALVEPWFEPSAARPGTLHLRTYESPAATIVRFAFASIRGNRSSIRYHYLIGERGRGIRHVEEVDVGLMLSRDRLLRLMRVAGLHARFLARGLNPGRGLLVGVKREKG